MVDPNAGKLRRGEMRPPKKQAVMTLNFFISPSSFFFLFPFSNSPLIPLNTPGSIVIVHLALFQLSLTMAASLVRTSARTALRAGASATPRTAGMAGLTFARGKATLPDLSCMHPAAILETHRS